MAHYDNPNRPSSQTYPPGLYIVATPIGNLRDITLRALDILNLADTILCEDTRVSAKLLSHYGIKKTLLSYHDHNGEERRPQILAMLDAGQRVALISDAGTPLVSDPGYKLVREVQSAGYHVSVAPGASSVLAALCLSGLPSHEFHFVGFLPTKSRAQADKLLSLAPVSATLIVFESARRLADTCMAMHAHWGNRKAAVSREITKLFEETKRGTLSELLTHYQQEGAPKGEVVMVIEGAIPVASTGDPDAMLRVLLASHSVKEAAALVAEQTGLPRKDVYARALSLKS